EGLEDETIRLQKSCRRLIWLNPLLRYEAYRPQSQGAKAMIRHVDDFRPIHNLDSMQDLANALGRDTMRAARPTRQKRAA
ncbi:MAG: VWA domain-containing protein, partial [Dongia sp.]